MSNTLSHLSHATGKPRHLVGVEYHRLTCPPDNNNHIPGAIRAFLSLRDQTPEREDRRRQGKY
jgi:hypothetical protein